MWAGMLGAVWIFYNGLLTCARARAALLRGRPFSRVRLIRPAPISPTRTRTRRAGNAITNRRAISAARRIPAPG